MLRDYIIASHVCAQSLFAIDQWLMLIADIHRPSSADELLLYIRKEKFYVMIVVFYVTMVAFLAPGLKILQSSHKTFCFSSIKRLHGRQFPAQSAPSFCIRSITAIDDRAC